MQLESFETKSPQSPFILYLRIAYNKTFPSQFVTAVTIYLISSWPPLKFDPNVLTRKNFSTIFFLTRRFPQLTETWPANVQWKPWKSADGGLLGGRYQYLGCFWACKLPTAECNWDTIIMRSFSTPAVHTEYWFIRLINRGRRKFHGWSATRSHIIIVLLHLQSLCSASATDGGGCDDAQYSTYHPCCASGQQY